MTTPLKQKLIDSPITDLSLWCGIFVYRVEKSNVEIEINLFLESIFIYCVDDSLIVLNWPECFNTIVVLRFEVIVLDLVVY